MTGLAKDDTVMFWVSRMSGLLYKKYSQQVSASCEMSSCPIHKLFAAADIRVLFSVLVLKLMGMPLF